MKLIRKDIEDALAFSETHNMPTIAATCILALQGLDAEKLARDRAALLEALTCLVKKLEFINSDSKFLSVWTMYHVHGGIYTGPTWVDELSKAQATIAAAEAHDAIKQEAT